MFATPWWVNLLVLVPLVSFYFWRRTGLAIRGRTLAVAAVFGIAFGFVEAAAVTYLRTASGLLLPNGAMPSYALPVPNMPQDLFRIEVWREAATIAMLASVALLGARRARERWAVFLYVFALWDLAYYAGLWALIGWPDSLLAEDVLFLIPGPWMAAVWYPVLVSSLSVLAVAIGSRIGGRERDPQPGRAG